jgi:hypothetical protein
MKPAYSSVALKEGPHKGGIISIQIAAKEWLDDDIVIDFLTGKVTSAVTFLSTHNWLTLTFTPNSYEYDEKPKSNKSGSYYEVSAAGIINYVDAALQQVLETLRYNQLVCLLTDRNQQLKLIGNKNFGMIFTIEQKNANNQSGVQQVPVSFYLETEDAPPFYEV